jgi:hypothetical protein
MQSNVLDSLEHDIHQPSYSFGNNLQRDVEVVVVELGHMNIVGHMFVELELVELVEHIVVVVLVVRSLVVELEVVVVGFHIQGKFEFHALVHILQF